MENSAASTRMRDVKGRALLVPSLRLWGMVLVAAIAAVLAIGVTSAWAQIAPGGTQIRNVARAIYIPAGFSQSEIVDSNEVTALVQSVEALSLTADQSFQRPPGATVTFSHLLSNVGNVPSSYSLELVTSGAECSSATLALSDLRVFQDSNNNGVVDAGDRSLALSSQGAVELEPGQVASLLVQGRLPGSPTGEACVVLRATTALQGQSASNIDRVRVGAGPAIQLTKAANAPSVIIPGQTGVAFAVTANNIGSSDALPSTTAQGPSGSATIRVNGQPTPLVLVRDEIPLGTQYVPGTLASASPGAIRLFRYPSDPPFSYRTIEDASAMEVAIGYPQPLVRNGTAAMNFSVLVNPEQQGNILNTAFAYFTDGTTSDFTPSNTVVLTSNGARIGLAKQASPPVPGRRSSGEPDGTIMTTFSVRIVNFGSEWLYDVQANDLLEGAGPTQFGSYTSAAVPDAGQYTIMPGSIRVAPSATPGIRVTANPGFTGQPGTQGLLASGAVLPVGGEITVRFDVRLNTSGRSATLLNSVRGTAAIVAGGPTQVSDVSTNGPDPDPDADGNPGNNSVPTPVSVTAPSISLVKSSSLPRRIADGVFEIDYTFRVTNTGNAVAPFVRVIDNLNCTFNIDDPQSPIADWQLIGSVRALAGVLVPSANYTGRLPCNRTLQASTDPFQLPTELALSLTDGSRSLAPGQSETLVVTVRATRKASVRPEPAVVVNKAWAAAFSANTVNAALSTTVAASSATVQSLLIDPSGTVYDSVSRSPIAGALVTYRRDTCTSGTPGPITAEEIYNGNSGL